MMRILLIANGIVDSKGGVSGGEVRLIEIARMGIGHAAFWIFPPEGESMETVLERLVEDVIPAVRAAVG